MNIFNELKSFAKDLTILIVEDDISLNDELMALCKLFFSDVAVAYSGIEALDKYKKKQTDIVLSDITMPHMNGVELSKQIKIINPTQDIIILSAHNDVKYFVELIDIGIRQFVHKPFNDEEFLYRLLKVCEQVVLTKFYESPNIYEDADAVKIKAEQDKVFKIKAKKDLTGIIACKQLSSQKFMSELQGNDELWSVLEEDIVTLSEISDDFEFYVNQIYEGNLSAELLMQMGVLLKKIQTILSQIESMREMSYILLDLAVFMQEIDFDVLAHEQKEKFKMVEFIYDDISRFVQTVFVYRDTIDIYYLKDSLKSSVEQLKNSVLNFPIQEEELEFF